MFGRLVGMTKHFGALRDEVQHLVSLGRMPSTKDEPAQEPVQAFVDALDALPGPLTDPEVISLLDSFPLGEASGLHEIEWSLVHAIESASYGRELMQALDDRSWWVAHLRKRAEKGS